MQTKINIEDANTSVEEWKKLHNISDDIKLPTLQEAYLSLNKNFNEDRIVTSEGVIRFLEYPLCSNTVAIHYISIRPNMRRKGYFTKFIKFLMEQKLCKIAVCGMTSYSIINCMKKIYSNNKNVKRYFLDHGGDAIWTPEGRYCDCHEFNPEFPHQLGEKSNGKYCKCVK